ncbi:MAG: hypothetical protein KAU90_04325 [Sulfurovaceae bacterium]|nr:hypothetical protein [Sulfurovaceae bacterium]
MKIVTKIATLASVLGINTLLASDNYALTNNYKLLNDMKLAKKQQDIITNINNQLNKNIIDIKLLKKNS